MESVITLAIVIALVILVGSVLGIAGFAQSRSAHRELREIRKRLDALVTEIAILRARAPEATSAPAATAAIPPAAAEAASATPASPAERAVPAAPATPVDAFASTSPDSNESSAGEPVTGGPLPGEPVPGQAVPAPPAPPRRDLETILTARWGIWLGSAALLLAGVFLIRYAVEQSLLGPGTRCALAALLGAALLAGAEWLFRHPPPDIPGPFSADQAPAGLAAGGTAILFGAAYGAGPFYGLLPPLPAFVALAIPGFIGLAASLRYGQITAAIGLAGAFVTPALVAPANPSLPGLFTYLLLVTAAALAVMRYTAWTWLGWAATVAGAIWVCLVAADAKTGQQLWAASVFIAASGALNLFLLPPTALDHPIGRRLAWVPIAVLGLSGLVMETADPDQGPLIALYALSALTVWRARNEPRLDRLPWLAALFGLLAILFWALPAWRPTGEAIRIEGRIEAFLTGDWAPELIRPLLIWAAVLAALHAAAGVWFERRAANPVRWSALTAAVPVLTLAVTYAQVARFRPSIEWAVAGLALAAGLTVAATAAAREHAKDRAGAHASGAAAALALGCAALLQDHWLTLAIALFLPALAWIEAAAELPALRVVAGAVAALVLIRLIPNWYILDYHFGSRPIANGLLAAYAAPSAAFTVAAWKFRRRGEDMAVTILEAGAIALASIFIATEIRHALAAGRLDGEPDFDEFALHQFTLAAQAVAYLVLAHRTPRSVLRWAWRILGAIALGVGALLILFNPAFVGATASVVGLAAAYLVPAALAVVARTRLSEPGPRLLTGAYALVAGFAWITLQIRHAFHPDEMGLFDAPIEDAELWAWSGAWMLYGIGLMVVGIRASSQVTRLAALGVIGLVSAKVFLIDMRDLTGLWRVLSFLALGLVLIGLTAVHRRFVLPKQQPPGGG